MAVAAVAYVLIPAAFAGHVAVDHGHGDLPHCDLCDHLTTIAHVGDVPAAPVVFGDAVRVADVVAGPVPTLPAAPTSAWPRGPPGC